MSPIIYRYDFDSEVATEDVEASLLLARIGAESLHGETAAQLEASHYFDLDKAVCLVDATDPAGHDFNALFAGFLRREFGPTAFKIKRVSEFTPQEPAIA
jgi:hypothetical protein